MSEPFIGQIQAFGFDFAPVGWAKCDGELLPISQNEALFVLLGTEYGGDGRTTFGLPDLRGRSMVHQGAGPGLSTMRMGQKDGLESVALSVANIPSHTHTARLHAEPDQGERNNPNNRKLANSSAAGFIYHDNSDKEDQIMDPGSIVVENTGGGQSFYTRSPYQVVNICIATVGVFPPRD